MCITLWLCLSVHLSVQRHPYPLSTQYLGLADRFTSARCCWQTRDHVRKFPIIPSLHTDYISCTSLSQWQICIVRHLKNMTVMVKYFRRALFWDLNMMVEASPPPLQHWLAHSPCWPASETADHGASTMAEVGRDWLILLRHPTQDIVGPNVPAISNL